MLLQHAHTTSMAQDNETAIAHMPTAKAAQRGVTLIELLIGLSIGLLTIAVAIGALMVSRGVSGTVSDSSQLQQQAAYAFRVLGQQLRQAGSLRLNLAAQKTASATIDAADPVAFETKVQDPVDSSTFDPEKNTISGIDNPGSGAYKLTVGYRNYTEPLYTSSVDESMLRNCLGQKGTNALIQSQFTLTNDSLMCLGTAQPEPIIQNVANFQVRYLVQDDTEPGNPKIRYVNATNAKTNWRSVFGVEVCLVLYGTEAIDMPSDSTYTDCPAADGTMASINMTTLSAPRTRRMHMVFRNVYQLRSQGLAG